MRLWERLLLFHRSSQYSMQERANINLPWAFGEEAKLETSKMSFTSGLASKVRASPAHSGREGEMTVVRSALTSMCWLARKAIASLAWL